MKQINKINYIPNFSNITSVAKMLNLELNEVFQIQMFTHKSPYKLWYKITEQGLLYSNTINGFYNHSDALEGIILGKHQIIKMA